MARMNPLVGWREKANTPELLERGFKDLLIAELSTASEIVTSSERMSQDLANLESSLGAIENGLAEIGYVLQWGMGKIAWQIELNRGVLVDIHQTLRSPMRTQAREYKANGDHAFLNGWFKEALADYKNALNCDRYDFGVHTSAGLIYQEHIKDIPKAISHFETATRYAEPVSSYHAGLSAIFLANLYHTMGQLTHSVDWGRRAHELSPSTKEVGYRYAFLLKEIGQVDHALAVLKDILVEDRLYVLKAINDELLSDIKERIEDTIRSIRDERLTEVHGQLSRIDEQVAAFAALRDDVTARHMWMTASQRLDQINVLVGRGSYFDILEALDSACALNADIHVWNKVKSRLDNVRGRLRSIAGLQDDGAAKGILVHADQRLEQISSLLCAGTYADILEVQSAVAKVDGDIDDWRRRYTEDAIRHLAEWKKIKLVEEKRFYYEPDKHWRLIVGVGCAVPLTFVGIGVMGMAVEGAEATGAMTIGSGFQLGVGLILGGLTMGVIAIVLEAVWKPSDPVKRLERKSPKWVSARHNIERWEQYLRRIEKV